MVLIIVLVVGISIIDYTISVTGEFGKTYSAGPNIGIYDVSGQPTISSKDWTQEIDQSSSGAVIESTSIFNDWVNGQYTGDITTITNNITALSGDLSAYYKKTETSSKAEISAALDYVSANAGKVYEGISPIVVNNTQDKISADTWALSAGSNVSFIDDNVNKITRIDVDLPQQDLSYISAQVDSANQSVNSLSGSVSSLSSTVNSNSSTWNDVVNKLDASSYHELSAGANINITDYVVSSKDWSSEISQASANAYNEATALIPSLTFHYVEV